MVETNRNHNSSPTCLQFSIPEPNKSSVCSGADSVYIPCMCSIYIYIPYFDALFIYTPCIYTYMCLPHMVPIYVCTLYALYIPRTYTLYTHMCNKSFLARRIRSKKTESGRICAKQLDSPCQVLLVPSRQNAHFRSA